jgi:hypothetical protein
MSSEKIADKLQAKFTCAACNQSIYGGLLYIVSIGSLDDIISADQDEEDHYHLQCLEPYTLLFGQLPGESIAVTLQEA